ncbi:hypothetical protein EYF80_004750 [Liparis tanakae]|uniref:Uncharacterized protein n=1 Tax=Liparis tanakae TaxID=230148 RepID=A0A4Z2J4I5_9TELE|nr:hypothetical protein EYF80_004750 [Liparis tanakae]
MPEQPRDCSTMDGFSRVAFRKKQHSLDTAEEAGMEVFKGKPRPAVLEGTYLSHPGEQSLFASLPAGGGAGSETLHPWSQQVDLGVCEALKESYCTIRAQSGWTQRGLEEGAAGRYYFLNPPSLLRGVHRLGHGVDCLAAGYLEVPSLGQVILTGWTTH